VEGHISGEPFGGGTTDSYVEGPRHRGVPAGRVHLAGGVEEAHISWLQGSSSAGTREVWKQHQHPPVSNLRRMVPLAASVESGRKFSRFFPIRFLYFTVPFPFFRKIRNRVGIRV
jgi:hypothetical protein